MQRILPLIVFVVAVVAAGAYFFVAGVFAPPQSEPPHAARADAVPATNVSLRDFSLPDLDGVERSLSEWAGNHRLLNFWATWCAPCRREIPLLKAFQDQYGEAGIQVIGIAVDFPEEVAAYAVDAQFNYPVLIGQEDAMALAESSGVDFIGMPFTMIVTADGELVKAHMGEIHQEDLDAIVAVFQKLDRGDIDVAAARTELGAL